MAGGGGSRILKELTLIVDVDDNKRVSARSVIEEAEIICGEGNVLAVVPRSGNIYEVTVKDKRSSDELVNTPFEIDGKRFKCDAIYSEEKVVSFLHLPAFIPDSEIKRKLDDYHAEMMSPIKRRMYPGTNIADGTRYVVVKFPPNISSLPYTMKFDLGKNKFEYIRVKHDNQSKVCSKCLSSDHLYAECPMNKCYRCNDYGHLSKYCPSVPCVRCNLYPSKCKCTSLDINILRRRLEREAENELNDDNSDIAEEYTTTKTNEVDEHDHNKAKKMRTDNDNTSKTQTAEEQDNTNDDKEQNNTSDDIIVPTSDVQIHDDEVQMNNTHSVNDAESEVDVDDGIKSDDELNLSDNETVVDSRTNLNSVNIDINDGKRGDKMSCDDKSEAVVLNQSTASFENDKVDTTSTSKNNEVEMDDNEMTEAMVRFGGKYRRHRIVPHPNIPYGKRRSSCSNQNTN